eukprot:1091968-Pyramimonas_sp.AAC.1
MPLSLRSPPKRPSAPPCTRAASWRSAPTSCRRQGAAPAPRHDGRRGPSTQNTGLCVEGPAAPAAACPPLQGSPGT